MVKFAFRQRIGKINWNIVSAVNIPDVIEHLKVNELQSVLDAITFCEFASSDVRNCPIETVAQLIQIFQFTVEFLLHSQENQNILIERIQKKGNVLKSDNRQLSAQIASLKEDTKIYQRQLSVLRQSMNIREPQNPRVIDLNHKKDSLEIQPIIASVLQSEKESRELLRVLLVEQRTTFMKELELSRLASVAAATAASESKNQDKRLPNTEETIEKFLKQMKDVLIHQQEQHKDLLNSVISKNDSMNNNYNNENNRIISTTILNELANKAATANDEEIIKTQKLQAELLLVQKELIQKSKDLSEKEENLLFDMRDFKKLKKVEKDKENAKIYLSSIDSLEALKPPNNDSVLKLREKSRIISAVAIKAQLSQALLRQKSKAFRLWVNKMMESRDRSQVKEHSRLLSSSAASHTRREQELLTQIQIEKQRALVEQARVNTAARAAEAIRQEQQLIMEQMGLELKRNNDNNHNNNNNSNNDESNNNENNNNENNDKNYSENRHEKELGQNEVISHKLQKNQSIESKSSYTSFINANSSTMTSVENPPSISSVAASATSASTSSSSSPFRAAVTMPAPTKIVTLDPWLISAMNTRLGSAINGDEALDLAHQRISNRRRDSLTERPQKDYMNMLASEIANRLKITDSDKEMIPYPIAVKSPPKRIEVRNY